MSGILKRLGKRRRYRKILGVFTGGLLLVAGLTLYLAGYAVLGILTILSVLAAAGAYALNTAVRKRMRLSVAPFAPDSKIRNVDYLVIGGRAAEVFWIPRDKIAVRLTAPSRSLYSSYEILRHTYGILKQGGTAVLTADQKESRDTGFTVYDIPVFEMSPVSVSRLHLEKLQRYSRIPLAVNFPDAIYYLWGQERNVSFTREDDCPVREIAGFCEERGIRFEYYTFGCLDKK